MPKRINYHQLGADFNLRYESCFVRYKTRGASTLETVQIRQVTGYDDKFPYIQMQGAKQGTMAVVYNTEGEFDFQFPETGYFNYRQNGYVFMRLPQRQNKRSMCTATSIRHNFYTKIPKPLWVPPSLTLDVADKIFNSTYFDANSALEALNTRRSYLAATDKVFALGLNITDSPNHLLFRYFTPIAEISKEGRLVKCFDQLFERFLDETPYR